LMVVNNMACSVNSSRLYSSQTSGTPSFHNIFKSSTSGLKRHQYGRHVALAQRPILLESYIFVSCRARVEGCTMTERQASCYVLSSGYPMGSHHLCS
jgi:hypothetical protein